MTINNKKHSFIAVTICTILLFFLVNVIILGPIIAGFTAGLFASNRYNGAKIGFWGSIFPVTIWSVAIIGGAICLNNIWTLLPLAALPAISYAYKDVSILGTILVVLLFLFQAFAFTIIGGYLAGLSKEKYLKRNIINLQP